jgi:hypothetical protein
VISVISGISVSMPMLPFLDLAPVESIFLGKRHVRMCRERLHSSHAW